MAAAKIIVVEKNEGEKIAYDVSTTKIIFGDDDLMVNIKNRERDEEVTLDICKDTQDGLTVGVNTEAREYVAQVIIPARDMRLWIQEKRTRTEKRLRSVNLYRLI